ncbi:MAG: hypothetical protein JRJ77_05370 [Deltaproteobacteria bacterium]|nr:hypothetical protein [Deltaproteobacteria bacterium]
MALGCFRGEAVNEESARALKKGTQNYRMQKSRFFPRKPKMEAGHRVNLYQVLSACSCKLLGISVLMFSAFFYSTISYASVNIPLDSPFYADIQTLIAYGVIKSDLSSTRPFTRSEAGRLLAEAIDNAEAEGISPFASEIVDRMVKIYKEDIGEATRPGSAPHTYLKPLDEFSITCNRLDGPFSIFNNEGIEYFDGNNAVIEFQSSARLWRVFSLFIQPMVIYNQNYGGIEGNNETEFRFHKAYLKLSLGNFEIQVGKDSLWWGPGYHGALLMSNNARPFEMIKISNPRATLLPWVFRYLGPFRYNAFFSVLDSNEAASEHPPNSEIFGLRFDFKPHPLLELGTSYLVHFDGDRPGIDSPNFSDYFYILFSEVSRGGDKRDSNKEIALDITLTIPNISETVPVADSIELYAEWGGEDSDYPPDRRAYLLGMVFNDTFMARGLRLRTEYARLSPKSVPGAWYKHGIWSMKYYGRVFGHHAGTDSDDLFVEFLHQINPQFFYSLAFDKERSGLSKKHIQEKQQFFLEARYEFKGWSNFTVRYAYEEIDNVANVKDSSQENHFIGVELSFRF